MHRTAVWRPVTVMGILVSASLWLPNLPTGAQETVEPNFKSKCAMCHGPDGVGKTKMGEMLKVPDFHSAAVQSKTDAELTQVISKGKNKMPGSEGKLSKEEIAKLVAFVREVGKKH